MVDRSGRTARTQVLKVTVAMLLGAASLALDAAPSGAATIPVTGTAVPSLAAFDNAMTDFMEGHGINGGTLAVSRDGKVLLERGYGWKDAGHATALPPSALLRIASNSKLITSRAIDRLVDAGLLARTTRVFCTPDAPTGCILNIEPPSGYTRDARLKDITVDDLVLHQGGWDTATRGSDIAFEVQQAATALGVPSPATKAQLARWVVGQPLEHDPGTITVYANIGYVILGLVVEQVSAKPFIDYVRQAVLFPAGTNDMASGRTLPAQRDPREPNYEDPNTGPNVYNPSQTVSLADGGYSVEALEAAGGLLSSSRAFVRFLEEWLPGPGWDYTTFGSLPGTLSVAMVLPSGTHLFGVLNAREEPDGTDIDLNEFSSVLSAAESSVSSWPSQEVDQVAPAVTAPVASVVDGTVPTSTTVATRLSWTGSDAQSGLARFQLQRSVDGGAYGTVALLTPAATASRVDLAYGHTYRFRVQATDRAGKQSAWKVSDPIAPKAVDNAAAAVVYSPGWTKRAAASSLFGTIAYTATANATARLSFRGRGITLVSSRGPNRGRAQVLINDVVRGVVDLYAAQAKPAVTVLHLSQPTSGSFRVTVKVLSTANPASSGKRFDVDAFLLR